MTLQRIILMLVTGALLCPVANAQYGHHVDRHNHLVQDRHGHIVGGVHSNSRYVLPHSSGIYGGTYTVGNGVHLYYSRTASLGSVSVAPTPEQITFGGFTHVDELAVRFETLMNQLCLDLYYNYSHNPGFHETYTEAYILLQTAKFMHDAEHHNDRDAIRSRLAGADALFHHVEEDFHGWSRIHHRQIGTMGILTKMEMAEATLHQLMNDVGVSATPGLEEAPAPQGEQAPLPLVRQ